MRALVRIDHPEWMLFGRLCRGRNRYQRDSAIDQDWSARVWPLCWATRPHRPRQKRRASHHRLAPDRSIRAATDRSFEELACCEIEARVKAFLSAPLRCVQIQPSGSHTAWPKGAAPTSFYLTAPGSPMPTLSRGAQSAPSGRLSRVSIGATSALRRPAPSRSRRPPERNLSELRAEYDINAEPAKSRN